MPVQALLERSDEVGQMASAFNAMQGGYQRVVSTVAQAAAAIRHIRTDDERTDTPDQDATLYTTAIEPLLAITVHPDPRVRRAAVRT